LSGSRISLSIYYSGFLIQRDFKSFSFHKHNNLPLAFNEVARSFVSEKVSVLHLDSLITVKDKDSIDDVRHYSRDVWQKVGNYTENWFSK